MHRQLDQRRAYNWGYAVGFVAALGFASPVLASSPQWVELCNAHGSVWKLIDRNGDDTPLPDQGSRACHSGCTLPRKVRVAR